MVGCNSGRATPFLRRHRPSAIPNHQPRRNATYHSREAVQTTEASSCVTDHHLFLRARNAMHFEECLSKTFAKNHDVGNKRGAVRVDEVRLLVSTVSAR